MARESVLHANRVSLVAYLSYYGRDIRRSAVARSRQRVAGDSSKTFVRYEPSQHDAESHRADVALSLDVSFHLVKDDFYSTFIRHLFDSAVRYVVIYSSHEDRSWTGRGKHHRNHDRWKGDFLV